MTYKLDIFLLDILIWVKSFNLVVVGKSQCFIAIKSWQIISLWNVGVCRSTNMRATSMTGKKKKKLVLWVLFMLALKEFSTTTTKKAVFADSLD